MTDSTQLLLVTTTFPVPRAPAAHESAGTPESPAARTVRLLVEEGLVACGQIVQAPVRSFFRWEDAVQDESEVLVLLKTTESRWEALQERLRALHPYEVPEIVACPARASQSYGAWLHRQCGAPEGP